MDDKFSQFVKIGLAKAHKLGASSAEFYIEKNRLLDIQVKNQQIDDMKIADTQGIGVRIIKNNQMGFSYSSDFSITALDQMVTHAITTAKFNEVDRHLSFATPSSNGLQLNLYDTMLNQYSMDEKVNLACETAKIAKEFHTSVSEVERAGYQENESAIWIANSNGVAVNQQSTYCGLYCLAIGKSQGEQQSGYGMDYQVKYQPLSPQKAGEMAALKSVQLLGAKSITSQMTNLVLGPQIAAQFLGIVARSFSADAVRKRKSLFVDKMNDWIANEKVSLVDDGTLVEHLGSAYFDGEGVSTSKTILVENGILKNLLYDTYSASKDGKVSSGNGMRGTYKGIPFIGTTNYYLMPGVEDPQRLLQSVDSGLYVTEILGAHTANSISGDFSFGAAGIWIEKGKLKQPVRGITIAGNLKEVLMNIEDIANDLTFFGSRGACTIKITKVAMSGA